MRENPVFNNTQDKRKQLDKWEERLKKDVGKGELLLGELGFRHQDLDEIGRLLADTDFLYLREKRYSLEKTIHSINNQWPLTYALYLVLEGIYNYESGDYWDGPIKQLGLQSKQTPHLGRLFLNILVEYNLPTFEQSGGHTYVTPILLHGGIPNDFLARFFDFLWLQEKRHHQIRLDSTSLLQAWRQKAEEYFRYLPKPARRFLEHGGLVATDFVERCLELFDTDSREEATALIDLPPRVIRAFSQWRDERGISTRTNTLRIRLQRPIIVIAPYETHVSLYLPPQQFPHQATPHHLIWQLVNSARTIVCRSHRIEGGVQFETEEQVDISPFAQYILHLEADGDRLQTWTLPGMTDPPILFFEPYDDYSGEVLVEQERFRPGERWLLYPQKHSWRETGESHQIKELPMPSGDWQGYKLEVWQLAPGEMILQDEKGVNYPFTIVHEKIRQRPYLIGGNRLPLPTTSADFPLYTGRPPTLMLYTNQPDRWQVTVRADGTAQPSEHQQKRLSQLPIISTTDGFALELSSRELLGETPVGKFEVVVRGPLGQNYHFGLHCIPTLETNGLEQLYLANANETAQLQFVCDHSTQIRQNPPQEGVELKLEADNQEQRKYTITALPEIRQINLQLRHDCGVVMPLTIPVHRLRWGIWSGKVETPIQWQTEPSTIYPGALTEGVMWVDIPIARKHQLCFGWRLINAQNKTCRYVAPENQPVQCRLEWSLAEVTAIWRKHQETLCWQLVIQQTPHNEPVIIPAFYLLPTPDFGAVEYEWRTENEQIYLTILWEHLQLGRYELRLWPLDRFWVDEPLILPLPETMETMVEWVLDSNQLPPEAYQVQLVAYNPWQSSRPQRPQPDTPHIFLLKPSGLSQYYTEISRLRDQGQASIEQLLALLTHQSYNGQRDELYRTNQAIAAQAEILALDWLICWADTIKRFDYTAYKTTQIKLFLPSMIDRLSQEQSKVELLERYFAHQPPAFLERIAFWILQSGLRTYRLACLETLCGLPLQNSKNQHIYDLAITALLDDVTNGILTVNKAVELLQLNIEAAIKWLMGNGGLDAKELLQGLVAQSQIEPTWVAPGMVLDSPYGTIKIEKLYHRATNQIRFCAPFQGDFYINGKLIATPIAVPIRLDLRYKQLHFLKNEPYQCQNCQQLFTSLADFSRHHKTTHTQLEPSRKQLKQDCILSSWQPRFAL